MKIKLQRVEQGVRVTVGGDSQPTVTLTLTPDEVATLTSMLLLATRSGAFLFDYETKG